jgi:hypothetical protein
MIFWNVEILKRNNFQITKFVKENIEIFKKVLFVEIKT